ncbi:unannotated protein [freshwater metagenome]|uniref:Unannotated protein n=1 Tax=freshwater metagenome TaxID=449393 RepID=A0A6J6U158_9ZZZZ
MLNFALAEYLRSAHLTTVLTFTVRPTVDVPDTATTGADANDACPGPMEFDALTVKVYVLPGTSPVTAQVTSTVEHMAPPGDASAVYEATAAPPLLIDAVQLTTA